MLCQEFIDPQQDQNDAGTQDFGELIRDYGSDRNPKTIMI